MKTRKGLILLYALLAILVQEGAAAPRTLRQMKTAAAGVLTRHFANIHRSAPATGLEVLRHDSATAVIGYRGGGYAVVTTDDLLPEVLGYSDTRFNPDNKNLQWWLRAQEQAGQACIAAGVAPRVTTPTQAGFPSEVAPMVTTNWGQEEPYNNLCPPGSDSGTGQWQGYGGTGRCVTGCVATAMAQVLNYKRIPTEMSGQRTLRVNQGSYYSTHYVSYTYDFSNPDNKIDWDNMLDNYYEGQYSEAQGRAVANLMLACGFACDMEYATDGSGAYTDSACYGMNRYFGIDCEYRDRSQYNEPEWMAMIYNELANDRPLMYAGVDPNPYLGGGHEFVFDGYNAQGQVHVNWGWDGSDNGYFDVATLDVQSYSWSQYQDMVIGIDGIAMQPIDTLIVLDEPGELTLLPDTVAGRISRLAVSGDINSSDLLAIRQMAGRTQKNATVRGTLRTLDLSGARIVEGGEPYLTDTLTGASYTTSDNRLPERAFFGTSLRTVVMPDSLTDIGEGAFALSHIDSIGNLPPSGASYILIDSIMYSPDTTTVIAVLPYVTGTCHVPSGVTSLASYALAGTRVSELILPATVTTLGTEALRGASSITMLRTYSKTVPATGRRCFDGVGTALKVYIPAGSGDVYKRHSEWRTMLASDESNFIEFGTVLKARNSNRFYGEENKRFGWQKLGDWVDGTPELTCDATPSSPAGRYAIHIGYGTVNPEGVDLEDGYLIVKKVPLDVRLDNDTVTITAGDTLSELHFVYSGFVLDDSVACIDTLATALADSAMLATPGIYTLEIGGAADDCYSFRYTPAVLKVEEAPVVDAISTIPTADRRHAIHDLQGRRMRATSTGELPKGIYIIDGRKVVKH